MFLVSSCSCLCPTYRSHVLSWEWRCSWSSADRRCSNYIWVINNLIAHKGEPYIRDFMVCPQILRGPFHWQIFHHNSNSMESYIIPSLKEEIWCGFPSNKYFLTLGLFGRRVIVVTCVCPSVRLSVCPSVCLSVPIILVNTITQSVYPISQLNLLGGFNMALSWMVL